ncbi:hypothetical protein MYCTH_2307128 [Thermothelomyces thermophilus ATCC 42464]|uniref:Uncharacterized protein n=1 Tax=Thermothelomyces thermophilus (strain ATCC 42464 / BCRC 31852 / DSM 1799) TaxID=573729 RepID=G2QFA0_THET4|nr:uncharacterized protein MYCTH_2307128 [Thermothelomyces thermophilus ATCC 42464]AEO59129.1 hypothetical protein MYCTH_2307128 [Thermothelomyces thermophilus ATCC 42464]
MPRGCEGNIPAVCLCAWMCVVIIPPMACHVVLCWLMPMFPPQVDTREVYGRTVCKLRVDCRCSSSEKHPNHPTPPKSAFSLCAYLTS